MPNIEKMREGCAENIQIMLKTQLVNDFTGNFLGSKNMDTRGSRFWQIKVKGRGEVGSPERATLYSGWGTSAF